MAHARLRRRLCQACVVLFCGHFSTGIRVPATTVWDSVLPTVNLVNAVTFYPVMPVRRHTFERHKACLEGQFAGGFETELGLKQTETLLKDVVLLLDCRHIFEGQKAYVEEYFAKDVETELGLDQTKLIRLAMLLGSDYTEGINGIGASC